jgi:hypothetical protein
MVDDEAKKDGGEEETIEFSEDFYSITFLGFWGPNLIKIVPNPTLQQQS